MRRAAIGSLLRKFTGGPGAYEGLSSCSRRTYRALGDGARPAGAAASQVLEVNRLVEALKPEERRP